MQVDVIDGRHLHYRRIGSSDAPLVVFANSLGQEVDFLACVTLFLGEEVTAVSDNHADVARAGRPCPVRRRAHS